MATSNNRDVRLGVEVATSGEDSLQGLAGAVRDVGAAGKDASVGAGQLSRELDALASATKQQREAEKSARTDAAAAKRELDAKRAALELLRAETDRAGRATADYEAREKALRVAVVEARTALRDKQATVTAAADAARTAAAAEAALAAQIQKTGAAAVVAGAQQATANRDTTSTAEVLQGQLAALRNLAGLALGGSLVGSLARDLSETADAAANLRARLQLVAGEGPALEAAYQSVFEIAQRTGAQVEATGTLFARILQAGKEFNLTQADALALTESINQAVAVSGTSAQSSEAALQQLIQGLQSGVLRGEEFNSVMEQAPRLARALADALGVTTGELRALAKEGALTSDVVIQALQGQSATLQREFDQLPLTVGRALANLGTAWTQYVGQVDQATGASRTAASAIGSLAANLDTVAGLLFGLGKAAAAYAALRLAQTFLANAAAAATLTAATTAATAATVANTAAQAANAAATGGSAVAAGRLAGVLGTLKTLSFLGVVTNLQSIGEAIGEGTAKLLGYGKAIERAEAQAKADEAATRANASAKAELAQRTEQATDRALGLAKESKALVAEFDGLTLKGGSVADALGKVAKSLDLSDLRGITTAGAALDALAQRGKITADQLRDTLGAALKGQDLATFEAQARAAFDGSAQGVRRLQAALAALADESLKRAGTSARELATGFNAASTSAINDLDALAATLDKLGTTGDDAGRLLARSVDQAVAAASTERAVRAVITRIEELGRSGRLAGDQLAQGLQVAQRKLDDLRGGVNTLDEALRNFGIKTRGELTATADKLGESYALIAGRADVSLQDQARAFATWRDAALAASGGVESGQVRLQRVMLETRLAAAGLGSAVESGMGKARKATDEAATSQERYNRALQGGAAGIGPTGQGVRSPGTPGAQDAQGNLPKIESFGDLVRSTPSGGITRTATGQIPPPPGDPGDPGDYIFVPFPADYGNGLGEWRLSPAGAAKVQAGNAALLARGSGGYISNPDGTLTYVPPAGSAAPAPAPAGGNYTVNVTIGGQTVGIGAASKADADRLIRQLEEAYRAGGGP